jgi:hypothetical protein
MRIRGGGIDAALQQNRMQVFSVRRRAGIGVTPGPRTRCERDVLLHSHIRAASRDIRSAWRRLNAVV